MKRNQRAKNARMLLVAELERWPDDSFVDLRIALDSEDLNAPRRTCEIRHLIMTYSATAAALGLYRLLSSSPASDFLPGVGFFESPALSSGATTS